MKKIILFIAFIAISIFIANNLITDYDSEVNNNQSLCEEFDGCNSRNVGSVKELGGRTYILVVYLSYDNGQYMPENEKNRLRKALNKSCGWISQNCANNGLKQEFVVSEYNHGFDLRVPRSYRIEYDSPNKVINNVLGSNFASTIKKDAKDNNCEDYMVLLCTDKNAVCQAYKENVEHYKKTYLEYLEGVVINTNVSGYLSTVISHEILHCFGAWDLYGDIYKSSNNTMYLKDELSKSVMTNTFLPLESVKIDNLTMYLTGITKTKQPWFNELAKNGAY